MSKSQRVLLIDPPLYKHPLWDPVRTSQPLGIWSIGSYLQALGHEVSMISAPLEGLRNVELIERESSRPVPDFVANRVNLLDRRGTADLIEDWCQTRAYLRVGLSEETILERVAEFDPDLIGIGSLASCLHQSVVNLSRAIRARFPRIPIIVGGQHATAMPEELLLGSDGAIDFVVLGEGEHTAAAILQALSCGGQTKDLKGIAFLENGTVVKTKRARFMDLTKLPALDPTLMAHVPLPALPVHTFGSQPRKFTDMLFSAGCHRNCPYCFAPIMRGRLRLWSSSDRRAARVASFPWVRRADPSG